MTATPEQQNLLALMQRMAQLQFQAGAVTAQIEAAILKGAILPQPDTLTPPEPNHAPPTPPP